MGFISGVLVIPAWIGIASFGIRADAIEFFRAKYLYIGFYF